MFSKTRLLILIAAIVFCQKLSANDLTRLVSYTFNDSEYVYMISLEKAESLPQWSWRSEDIPLSTHDAIRITDEAFRKKYSDVNAVYLKGIELLSLGKEGTKKDIWTYKIRFIPLRDGTWDRHGFYMVIVLFDGSVIFHE